MVAISYTCISFFHWCITNPFSSTFKIVGECITHNTALPGDTLHFLCHIVFNPFRYLMWLIGHIMSNMPPTIQRYMDTSSFLITPLKELIYGQENPLYIYISTLSHTNNIYQYTFISIVPDFLTVLWVLQMHIITVIIILLDVSDSAIYKIKEVILSMAPAVSIPSHHLDSTKG